jgi:glycerol kinase
MKHLLSIDQGTTGTKVLLMTDGLKTVAEKTIDFKQHFPKPSWVEHDPEEIWQTVLGGIKAVTESVDPKSILAIGITNQRETICFWDKKTGLPLSNAIVWQDRRTADHCEELKKKGLERFFQESSGLLLDPYFSATKIAWALKNWPNVSKAQKEGRLAVGTIDSYLMARISGGTAHFTEASNASRTLAFHLKKRKWDPDLCNGLGIPMDIFPEVLPSFGIFTQTHGVPGLPNGIPVSGVLGDQQSALLGQACVHEGMAKCMYGTGAFMLMNTGATPVPSRHRLLTTIAWEQKGGAVTYALEGSAFIAGAAIQWLRDGLKVIKSADQIEALAATVPSSEGVVFVPSFTGLGAPYWDPHATGMITGLTRGTSVAHLARAALEGIAFQNADILTAMQSDLGKPLKSLNVDGGASVNNLLMQFQADVLGIPLTRPVFKHTTALGALFAAGMGIGLWKDFSEIEKAWKPEQVYTSKINAKDREALLKVWHKAIKGIRLLSDAG